MESIKNELTYRLEQDLNYFKQKMPREVAIAWRGYFAALLEWDVIDISTHDSLWDLLPDIDNDPVNAILLGRDSIREVMLTKAQFAVLFELIAGAPFVLDKAGLDDLELNAAEIEKARNELNQNSYMYGQEISAELAEWLTVTNTVGWKCIVQLQSQKPDWVQIAIHFGEDVLVGEAINRVGERLLAQFGNVGNALDWMLNLTPNVVEGRDLSPTKTLDELLPQALTVITLLITNTAEVEDGAKVAILWLMTDSGLWFIDGEANEAKAVNITGLMLRDRLQNLINRHIPTQIGVGDE